MTVEGPGIGAPILTPLPLNSVVVTVDWETGLLLLLLFRTAPTTPGGGIGGPILKLAGIDAEVVVVTVVSEVSGRVAAGKIR